jgi:hypothetical protein
VGFSVLGHHRIFHHRIDCLLPKNGGRFKLALDLLDVGCKKLYVHLVAGHLSQLIDELIALKANFFLELGGGYRLIADFCHRTDVLKNCLAENTIKDNTDDDNNYRHATNDQIASLPAFFLQAGQMLLG